MSFRVKLSSALFGAGLALAAPAAFAQSNPGYFMPPSQSAPAHAPSVAPSSAPAPAPAPSQAAQPAQPALPPVPNLPALPPEPPPPAASIGVLSVPEVMQKSTAAQGVQAVIQERQKELGDDAKQAQAKIQAEQQAILAERSKLSDSQLEAKEQALRNEIAATQTKFQLRNQAIQNSGEAALGQIDAELIAIVKQVTAAHGINLLLHREQVVLNKQEFDVTAEVAAELNKLLPSVDVPPSVVTPGMTVNPPPQDDGQGDGQ